jgi:two-component system, response regulator PdtaR
LRFVVSRPVLLLVEDQPVLRMLLAEIFETEGVEVLEAGSADEALVLLAARRDVAILFTDVKMPGSIDGLALARRVGTELPHVRLFVTSGHLRLRERDLPPGATFVPKPFGIEPLLACIRAVLPVGHS